MLLDAIDHVQLAMPRGGEDTATGFYEGVLGIPRVPKPTPLDARGGCWFERGNLRVHLGAQDDFTPATKAHPAFAVVDLDRLAASLTDAGIATERIDGPDTPQLYANDPFGNRLEFRPARPVAERAAYADVIESVATATGSERFGRQLAFIDELDRLKSVERESFILGGLRRESTAEHSWHIAMIAAVLAEHATGEVDIDRVIRMLLVHDIVEIDAGDTAIYDTGGATTKADREVAAADRLFGLLPSDLADRFRSDWDEYERGSSTEARFARAADRLAPFLLNLAAEGITWQRWNVDAESVRGVCAPIADGSTVLAKFVEALIDRAIADGLLPDYGEPLDGAIAPARRRFS